MRGTPFLHEGWVGGLNTIDSPYTVEETESRDCLNVVSTTRGAIRKRTGSTLFTPAQVPEHFPALVTKDSFERANENPLSNSSHWSLITSAHDVGQVKEESFQPQLNAPNEAGARWNVEEVANPAVGIELHHLAIRVSRWIAVWACLSATEKSGYRVRLQFTANGLEIGLLTLEKWSEGALTLLGEKSIISPGFEVGDSLGITVRSGVVQAWRKHSGTWTSQITAADSSYTTGYTGIAASGLGEYTARKFAYAETAANIPTGELTSLASVTISGTKWLIASTGAKIYSINTGGEFTEIGSGFTAGSRWAIVEAPAGTGVSSKGPIYMTNGTDAPQEWTGSGSVGEWTGLASAVEKTDGEEVSGSNRYTSKTANFVVTDVGLVIEGEGIPTNTVVLQVLSSTTIELSNVATATGTGKHFTLKRTYYETAPHVPKGKYMVFAGNRIWMTGISSDPSAVWFSELVNLGEGGGQGDPTAWPRTNVVRFDHSDGKPITGIGVVGTYVIVFKERKIWIIHDLNTGANRKLSDTIGCAAHRTIVETQLGTFFLTLDQGVYLCKGGTQLEELSYKVRPTILGIDQAKRENACAFYFNNHFYISFPSGTSTTNNRTLDYDVALKTWWLHDLAMNQWVLYEPGSEPWAYGITPGTGEGVRRAFVPEVFTDVGKNYTGASGLSAYWLSAWFPFYAFIFRHRVKQPGIKKRVRQLHLDGSGELAPMVLKNFQTGIGAQQAGVVGSGSLAMPHVPVNFSEGETIFGNEDETQLFGGSFYKGVEMIFGGSATTQAARLYSLGTANLWSIGFGNNTSQPFEVDSFTLAAQFRKS